MALAGRRWTVVLLTASLVAAGCGGDDATAPPSPSGLTGRWNYSYNAIDTKTKCPLGGPRPGCGGGGTFDLVQVGRRVTGTYSTDAGCQRCGHAWEYGGTGTIRSTGHLTTFEFTLNGCEFRADLPIGSTDRVVGTVRCGLEPGPVALGTWRMTRTP